jgi:hypothetical protein
MTPSLRVVAPSTARLTDDDVPATIVWVCMRVPLSMCASECCFLWLKLLSSSYCLGCRYNHYSLLKSVEDNWGLGDLGAQQRLCGGFLVGDDNGRLAGLFPPLLGRPPVAHPRGASVHMLPFASTSAAVRPACQSGCSFSTASSACTCPWGAVRATPQLFGALVHSRWWCLTVLRSVPANVLPAPSCRQAATTTTPHLSASITETEEGDDVSATGHSEGLLLLLLGKPIVEGIFES